MCSQCYGFSSSHIRMWEWDHQEGWALKNWCFWTVVWEKTPESSLDYGEIQPVNPTGNQPLNIHWKDWCWSWSSNTLAPNWKTWLIGKDPDTGKDWRREEKGTAEGEMVEWHHQLNGHEFEAWRTAIHGVTKSQTRLNDWTTTKCDPDFNFVGVNRVRILVSVFINLI